MAKRWGHRMNGSNKQFVTFIFLVFFKGGGGGGGVNHEDVSIHLSDLAKLCLAHQLPKSRRQNFRLKIF